MRSASRGAWDAERLIFYFWSLSASPRFARVPPFGRGPCSPRPDRSGTFGVHRPKASALVGGRVSRRNPAWIELLALSGRTRPAFSRSASSLDGGPAVSTAGAHLGLTVFGVLSEQIDPQELRRLFDEAIRERADAAVVSSGGFFLAHRQLIVELAAASRLPAMYAFRDFIEAGGLAAYGPDLGEEAERLASQVDQVLKGAKLGDVPVYQASKFALVINITTARALGLTIPPTLLARADEVIE
jgi:hypothetical protein